MTYCQMIQRLDVEKMADVFRSFLEPWIGNISAEEKDKLHEQLVEFLKTEVNLK